MALAKGPGEVDNLTHILVTGLLCTSPGTLLSQYNIRAKYALLF